MPAPPTRRSRKSAPPSGLRRVQFVWLALLASVTLVGGFLLLVDGRPIPRLDGLAMPALAEAGTPNTLESIFRTREPIQDGQWTGIVIHHSGAPSGSAASISRQHEQMGFTGLGHHFIVGNGSGMADGEVYVAYRWLSQLPGAHAAGPDGQQHNLHSISICLVGDGRRQGFSEAQIRRAAQLTATLCRQLGIPAEAVRLHSDIAQTEDPGPLFPAAAFRSQVAGAL